MCQDTLFCVSLGKQRLISAVGAPTIGDVTMWKYGKVPPSIADIQK